MASKATDMRAKPTRRDLLKTTATLAATGALALNRAALAGTKEPADAAAGMLPQVDAVLGTAVSAEDVPGVVAWPQPKPASFTKGSSAVDAFTRGRR